MVDWAEIKSEFPIFAKNPGLVYLDNAATSQKPNCVIEAVDRYYREYNSNIHRGLYDISELATEQYEQSRALVAKFLGAEYPSEIIFTRNATESINLLRYTWAEDNLQAGDKVLITVMEHHSNMVPWLDLQERRGIELVIVDLIDGSLTGEQIAEAIDEKVKFVSVTALSNVLGLVMDLKPVIARAHEVGAKVLVDACQAAVSTSVNVRELDCDFLVMSGHKLYGPTGIGVLYAKQGVMQDVRPFMTGGSMIKYVEKTGAVYQESPQRYEAGTPNIAGAIGLGVAVNYLSQIGMKEVEYHNRELLVYAEMRLRELDFIRVIGDFEKLGVISFLIKGVHPHDVAQILAQENIASRAGYHCAEPLISALYLLGTVRVSFGIYNSKADVEALVVALQKVKEVFG